jgi:hypothetical protein
MEDSSCTLPPRKRQRTDSDVAPLVTHATHTPSTACTDHPSNTTTTTTSDVTVNSPPRNSNKQRNTIQNVLKASVQDIHAHAQNIANLSRKQLREEFGYTPPLPLSSVVVNDQTNDLTLDEPTSFLYFCSVVKALSRLRRSHSSKKSIRIFPVMKHSDQLFDIVVNAAKVAKCNVDIQAVCLASKISSSLREKKKQRDSNFSDNENEVSITSQIHLVTHLLESHGRAVSTSHLPEQLRQVLCTGRMIISDAIGCFGGNNMIGEIMNAASTLFLEKEIEEEDVREEQEVDSGTTTPLSAPSSTHSTPYESENDDEENTTTTTTTTNTTPHNIMIPSKWTSIVAPVFMPGAFSMIQLTKQMLDEPFTCDITNVAQMLSPPAAAWTYSMNQGSNPPNLKISAHLTLEIKAFYDEKDQEGVELPSPPLPTHIHGLVGTCVYDMFNGIQLVGGLLPNVHPLQMKRNSSLTDLLPKINHSCNTSTIRTVFFPLVHPLHLQTNKVTYLDVSIFRTVCGSDDVYYFWDIDEDALQDALDDGEDITTVHTGSNRDVAFYSSFDYDRDGNEEQEEANLLLELQQEEDEAASKAANDKFLLSISIPPLIAATESSTTTKPRIGDV